MQYKFKLSFILFYYNHLKNECVDIHGAREKHFFKVANQMSGKKRFFTFLTSREIMTDDTSIISISIQFMGGNIYLMCKLSELVINICLLHFFYLTLSKFLWLRHVSMPYFQFWRPCLLLPCKKRGDWFTGKPDVGLNYHVLDFKKWILFIIDCINCNWML